MARSVFKAVLLSTAAATLAAAPPLFAQGAGNSSTGDGLDIVVTAQKREQNINDTSLSITALGAAGLEALGRQDVTALAGQVPGLQVNQYSPTITVFNLRGVSQNDFGDSQEAPVAFYNDEVYVSALGAISGQTFDLERVEVLRGPQGTLFGRNATGGLVQIVTAKPTGSFEGFITLTGGSHGQFATEAAISGPLSDRVRGRLSFTSNHHGGYIDNDIGPDRGGTKFYAGRAQLEADVGSRGKLSLKLQGLRNDHDRTSGAYSHVALGVNEDGLGYALAADEDFWGTCAGCDAFGYRDADGDPYTGSFNFDGRFNRKYWSATLRYDHEFDGFDFVSITDYQDLEKSYSEDTDMSPAPVFVYRTNQDLYQLSQELRLSGKSDKLTWLAGLYGLKIVTNNVNQVDLLSGTPDSLVADYDGRQKTESLAVFGQVEYAFAPEVSLILGARYSWDWKEHWLTVVQTYFDGSSDRFEFNPTLFPDLAKLKFDNYSLKAQVDFRPTDGVLIYAGVNRGTKSGGFGVQSFIPDPAT
ncbi:MAG TPA: TonB-dependent receptor, partial [Rhizorhapis sp.]|nr:TonB-dependent receptor [Rhizorhapis sp.]